MLLREAAELTAQPTLKRFLTSRADAFLTNDYYASDVAWMELDASIEPTIGPYEVYEDEWFNSEGGVRSVHHGSRRSRIEKAAVLLRAPAGARERAADRSEVPQPAARLAGPHPRRQRRLHRRRRQPRRADRGVQPAERRTRREGKRHQARDAEEHAGREVQPRAGADQQGRALGGGSEERRRSTRSSPTS